MWALDSEISKESWLENRVWHEIAIQGHYATCMVYEDEYMLGRSFCNQLQAGNGLLIGVIAI